MQCDQNLQGGGKKKNKFLGCHRQLWALQLQILLERSQRSDVLEKKRKHDRGCISSTCQKGKKTLRRFLENDKVLMYSLVNVGCPLESKELTKEILMNLNYKSTCVSEQLM